MKPKILQRVLVYDKDSLDSVVDVINKISMLNIVDEGDDMFGCYYFDFKIILPLKMQDKLSKIRGVKIS